MEPTDGAALGQQLSTAVVLFHEAVAAKLGLSAIDHKALGVVLRRGPLPASALAAELHMKPSAVTALVDRLTAAGYVTRRPDPADRRRVLVSAVDSAGPGHPVAQIFADLGHDMAAFMSKYDERELATILDYVTNTVAVLTEQTRKLTGVG